MQTVKGEDQNLSTDFVDETIRFCAYDPFSSRSIHLHTCEVFGSGKEISAERISKVRKEYVERMLMREADKHVQKQRDAIILPGHCWRQKPLSVEGSPACGSGPVLLSH